MFLLEQLPQKPNVLTIIGVCINEDKLQKQEVAPNSLPEPYVAASSKFEETGTPKAQLGTNTVALNECATVVAMAWCGCRLSC